ncbi:uncharacterized protein MYCFIDRAFT_173289 [Pseudocercospora fijiensis CIRAD86]|uniref:Uncharacterized protein n=1 Tax=Pseudocercospora fijiensis (strain CIRAD86) TaxID=383855 RepID=M3AI61_PSEFD|nr:uncharacterized protein MYCFIDRAFT_173289 [Pseudocercospora fijiensis CIRAD86]EME84261.1 hypothetical protein MYCFIDRAFT_173289 [Pseudocercospora fijiensis CIRAD86]
MCALRYPAATCDRTQGSEARRPLATRTRQDNVSVQDQRPRSSKHAQPIHVLAADLSHKQVMGSWSERSSM